MQYRPVTSLGNACSKCVHQLVTSQVDHMVAAWTYCMGSKVSSCSGIYFTTATLEPWHVHLIDVKHCCRWPGWLDWSIFLQIGLIVLIFFMKAGFLYFHIISFKTWFVVGCRYPQFSKVVCRRYFGCDVDIFSAWWLFWLLLPNVGQFFHNLANLELVFCPNSV